MAARLLPRPVAVQAACDCAETSIHLTTGGGRQMAAMLALHIAREWAEDREDVGTVRAAADAAAYAAAYAVWAADAAAYAVWSAEAAARAAAAGAYAYAAGADARTDALRDMAALVRRRIPGPMIVAATVRP